MIQDADHKTARVLLRHAPLAGARLVEVGCGDGRVTAMLRRETGVLLGVEPDAAPLRAARERVKGPLFCAGVGEYLPCASGSWDVVLFTLSLHHAGPSAALAEAARALRPGGFVLALEPMVDGIIQQGGHLFEDESHRLEAAMQALQPENLAQAGLGVIGQEEFATVFHFDGVDDVWRYFHDYYEVTQTPERDAAMRDLFGSRLERDPLVLHDWLRLTAAVKL